MSRTEYTRLRKRIRIAQPGFKLAARRNLKNAVTADLLAFNKGRKHLGGARLGVVQ